MCGCIEKEAPPSTGEFFHSYKVSGAWNEPDCFSTHISGLMDHTRFISSYT
jgi:hypothetical protein